jgi:solute carrier family 25 protein 39/40
VIYYSFYDELLHFQGDHRLAPLNAAIVARTFEVTLRTPLELLRTQLQAAEGEVTLLELLQRQRHQPLSAWMRGYFPTLMRDVPFSGIYWFAYEEAKKLVTIPEQWVSGPGARTLIHSFVCGGSAGMLAALLTTPIDVAKTLRQKLSSEAASGAASTREIANILLANPRAGLTGLGPRLLRIPLGLATMMSGIETTRWLFERERCRQKAM